MSVVQIVTAPLAVPGNFQSNVGKQQQSNAGVSCRGAGQVDCECCPGFAREAMRGLRGSSSSHAYEQLQGSRA